ncbi:hypothetical protein Tco_1207434, partial [Tanacetum coccineum]
MLTQNLINYRPHLLIIAAVLNISWLIIHALPLLLATPYSGCDALSHALFKHIEITLSSLLNNLMEHVHLFREPLLPLFEPWISRSAVLGMEGEELDVLCHWQKPVQHRELEMKRILLDIFKEKQQKSAEAGTIPSFYKK